MQDVLCCTEVKCTAYCRISWCLSKPKLKNETWHYAYSGYYILYWTTYQLHTYCLQNTTSLHNNNNKISIRYFILALAWQVSWIHHQHPFFCLICLSFFDSMKTIISSQTCCDFWCALCKVVSVSKWSDSPHVLMQVWFVCCIVWQRRRRTTVTVRGITFHLSIWRHPR